jgi:hypothetical protein
MALRTLTSGMNSAVAATVTRPGYLVKIDWTTSVVSRFTSLPDVTYNSESYLGRDVQVNLAPSDGTGIAQVTVRIGNDSQTIGALVLSYGFSSKRVRVWKAYATGDYPTISVVPDPVVLFDGEGNDATIDPENVTLNALMGKIGYQLCPRRRVGPSSGFHALIPAGTRLTLGGQTFVLERRK